MRADSTAGLGQALDFRDECDALHSALENAPAEAWAEPTQFKGWTFDDVLGHLNFFDHAAEIAARNRDEVQALFRDIFQASTTGVALIDYSRRWLQGCAGSALLERWHGQYQRLAEIYATFEPGHRLAWAGPDMSARSFMSARQMETWAHGQAIFDALGSDRVEHDRLRNIAVMGVNTFGWTFMVNRREVPAVRPYVRLTSPSGALWEWNDPATAERVEGSAVEFCRVVTQTRNLLDTNLAVTGAIARQWLEHAQCFAGPPQRPPAPGTRFKQGRYNCEW
jgi:uncharacterized protein (TIGR03084 family)